MLEPRTVEMMGAVHRYGSARRGCSGPTPPWGLGVAVDFSGGTGRRAFGHGGMASSRGLADPECGLVMVSSATGSPDSSPPSSGLFEVTDAVYTALGDRRRLRFRRSIAVPNGRSRSAT